MIDFIQSACGRKLRNHGAANQTADGTREGAHMTETPVNLRGGRLRPDVQVSGERLDHKASSDPCAMNLLGAVTKGLPVSSAILEATSCEKPFGAFKPVP